MTYKELPDMLHSIPDLLRTKAARIYTAHGIDDVARIMHMAADEIEGIADDYNKVVSMLRDMEFVNSVCPWCDGPHYAHYEHCELYQILKKSARK